eukprot:6212285-Pleurochrysis_carterae.AAC.1
MLPNAKLGRQSTRLRWLFCHRHCDLIVVISLMGRPGQRPSRVVRSEVLRRQCTQPIQHSLPGRPTRAAAQDGLSRASGHNVRVPREHRRHTYCSDIVTGAHTHGRGHGRPVSGAAMVLSVIHPVWKEDDRQALLRTSEAAALRRMRHRRCDEISDLRAIDRLGIKCWTTARIEAPMSLPTELTSRCMCAVI